MQRFISSALEIEEKKLEDKVYADKMIDAAIVLFYCRYVCERTIQEQSQCPVRIMLVPDEQCPAHSHSDDSKQEEP